MLPIRMLVRDVISQRLWKVSDALEDYKRVMWGKEEYVMRTILNALPTPSKAIRFSRDVINNLAYSVCPNCEVCNCWPCQCAKERERAEFNKARKTWLTYEMTDFLDDILDDIIDDVGPEGMRLDIAMRDYMEDPTPAHHIAYRAVAWDAFNSNIINFTTLKNIFFETETEEWTKWIHDAS